MGNQLSLEIIAEELDVDKELITSLSYVIDAEDEYEDYDEDLYMAIDEESTKKRMLRIRLDWVNHVKKCLHENSFSRKYRMSHGSFCRLVTMLEKYLARDPLKASRGMYISPEIIVAIGIRFLAGEPYTALNDIANISTTSVYRLKNRFIRAVLEAEELKIKMPQTAEEWETVRIGFENISSHKLFRGCVSAIDGYFAVTQQPYVKDANGNPMAYMSGHYGMFGLNCQGICDAREHFLFFGVVAPGKTNDVVAFELCHSIKEALSALPYGLFIVSDAAYTLSEKLLVPFVGSQKKDPLNDAYNFYLSQVRIRIEMAFARMVTKWRILRAPLLGSLRTISRTLMACAVMHNYVIDSDEHNVHLTQRQEDNVSTSLASDLDFIVRNAPGGMTYLPTIPNDGQLNELEVISLSSTVQASLLQVIDTLCIRRPRHNIERNGIGAGERIPAVDVEYYAPS
jgi:hypothetical protein